MSGVLPLQWHQWVHGAWTGVQMTHTCVDSGQLFHSVEASITLW